MLLDSRLGPTLSCLVAEKRKIFKSATFLPQQQIQADPRVQADPQVQALRFAVHTVQRNWISRLGRYLMTPQQSHSREEKDDHKLV